MKGMVTLYIGPTGAEAITRGKDKTRHVTPLTTNQASRLAHRVDMLVTTGRGYVSPQGTGWVFYCYATKEAQP